MGRFFRPPRMKPFLDEDFLLDSEVAIDLYRRFAASQPILDYHNHLSPSRSPTITASRRSPSCG